MHYYTCPILDMKLNLTLLNILSLGARGIALVQEVACKMHSKFRGILPLKSIIAYRN